MYKTKNIVENAGLERSTRCRRREGCGTVDTLMGKGPSRVRTVNSSLQLARVTVELFEAPNKAFYNSSPPRRAGKYDSRQLQRPFRKVQEWHIHTVARQITGDQFMTLVY